jgi:hypothetical protein
MRGQKQGWLVVIGLLSGGLLCAALMGQQAQKPLTNSDIIKMVRGGVPASVIVSSIQSSPTHFDLSPEALIRLHKLGVSKGIMDAMMAAASKQAPATAEPPPAETTPAASAPETAPPVSAPETAPPASAPEAAPPPAESGGTAPSPPPSASTPGLPAVIFLQGDAQQPIALERTQLEETKVKPSSMLSLASDSALAPVLQNEINTTTGAVASRVNSGIGSSSIGQAGGLLSGIISHRKPAQTYVWAVQNPASSNVLPTTTPAFSVDFSGVAGVNPTEYKPAIVKLTPAQNAWRLVGATQGKGDATSSSALNWEVYANFLEDQVPLSAQKTAPGQYRISPAAPLLPGEYAVVLRPISRSKKFSGADVARGQGDGLMFDSAWSFEVAMPSKPQ